MFKLADLAFLPGRPELVERMKKNVRDALVAEGRNARRLGLPISRCPPFRDNDMAIDWMNGWRWEDEGWRP